jgi:hypothetical protein
VSTNYVQQRLTDLATAIQTAATAIGDLSAQLAGLDAADPQRVTVQATLDNTTALRRARSREADRKSSSAVITSPNRATQRRCNVYNFTLEGGPHGRNTQGVAHNV